MLARLQLFGNTSGLAPSQVKALERIYRRRVPFDVLTTPELTRSMTEVSYATGRQIGVMVDRAGVVNHVIVGDANQLFLPDVGRLRAAQGRLRGLRLIHTHLRNEPLTRDDVVDLTRLRLDLIAAICIDHAGRAMWVYYGHNIPLDDDDRGEPFRTFGPIPYSALDVDPGKLVVALEQEFARSRVTRPTIAKDGRAMLVHVSDKRGAIDSDDSVLELKELARTAGVEVADTIKQIRQRIDPKYVLGRGKLDDVVIRAMQLDVEVLIFDRELGPNQAASIASVTDLKVLDRTQLILDIFAQHAHSTDGKLQVELAQMKYLLPRLGQKYDSLSRLAGGIGGRGPGETKLEIGRRRARERIARLEAQLKKSAKQRKQRRAQRKRNRTPMAAVVGYTNAGKSTLLNTLTKSAVIAEDKLFATLETRTRRLWMAKSQKEVLLTDTVGFIRNLPKDLFQAFRSTFEEAQDADLLIHVIDASDPARDQHLATTEELFVELNLSGVPRLVVYNKADATDVETLSMIKQQPGVFCVSALDKSSLVDLLGAIDEALSGDLEAKRKEIVHADFD